MIIAEAGVNHNGSLDLANALVESAAQAGADIVKFQIFRADRLATANSQKASYQKQLSDPNESQLDMLRRLELRQEDFSDIAGHCRSCGVEFVASPFDMDAIDICCALGVSRIKIPSGEITNYPYLKKIGTLGIEVLLSTGMSTLGEVEDAVNLLIQGGTIPDQITLLHCTTEYPAPVEETNLRAMQTLRSAFPQSHRVGFSDHTAGHEVALAAVAMGASVIEKHFTQNRNLPGPDHRASMEPGDFARMVKAIRSVESAMGNGVKAASRSESLNKEIVRKSLVAAEAISKGTVFTEHNVCTKRPGNGISPMRWPEIMGTMAARNYAKDEFL